MEKIDSRQRLILVIVLTFGFMMTVDMLFPRQPPPAVSAVADAGVEAVAATPLAQDAGMAPNVAAGTVEKVQPPSDLPEREIERVRDQISMRFSTEGGSLVSAELRGPREKEQAHVSIAEGYQKLLGKKFPPPPQMNMAVPVPKVASPLAVAFKSGAAQVQPQMRYQVIEETDQAVAFRAQTADLQIDKRYHWEKDTFGLSLDVTVKNLSAQKTDGSLEVMFPRSIDPNKEEKSSLFGGIGNETKVHCLVGDEINTHGPQDDAIEAQKGDVKMAALDQQYFLAALYPLENLAERTCSVIATNTVRMVTIANPLSLAPGESKVLSFGAFLGPKDFELLKAQGHGLERTVDFGWWAVLCKMLLWVLKFFQQFVGNWGLAIILLTLSVKILLLPLTHKAMVAAESMKELQPKMEEIKKKFGNDRERQNQEVMKMYQEAKVNPLGGCLPLLMQIPVFTALFTTLRTSYELYGEPFYGPVWTDLTYKDPTYLLPFALGVTMIITQRLQPQMPDKQQAFMMTWIMPIFFTALMMNYPAGLSLYFFTNNLLSILQQYLLRKYLKKKKDQAALAPPGSKNGRLKESAS